MQRGQNSRTAGAVSYGVGFLFELVNIMQPQNCTTRLRRLVWTSFFLCVVFLFHLFFMIFFFIIWGFWLREECIFQLHLHTTNFVCRVHFLDNDLQVFILNFVQTSLQEDILWYYIVILFKTGLCATFWSNIWTHVWSWGDKHVATILLDPDCTEEGYCAPRRGYKFST